MTTFIKPYSFSDFVDRSWSRWKFHALHDAFNEANKIQIKAIIESNDASGYAYAGNVSNMPLFYDASDYKFLCQFLPEDWNKALTWRYNEGSLLASEARESHDEKSFEAIENEIPSLKIGIAADGSFDNGYRVYYGNNYGPLWTGMQDLVLKLEAPHRMDSAHNPTSIHPKSMRPLKPGPGLKDIDPWETDENSPKHPKHYFDAGGGAYNYDMSGAVRVSDDDINKIPDSSIEVPAGTPPEKIPEIIKKKRKAMLKNRHHTFAGFSVLQGGPLVSDKIHDWRRMQGLGFLDDIGNEWIDPHTGQKINVSYKMPKESKIGFWSTHSGSDGQGGKLDRLPVIQRRLFYKEFNKKGKEVPISEEDQMTHMPVLTTQKTLPRLPSGGPFALTMKQREEIARRKGWWPDKADKGCPGKYQVGMTYEQLAQVCGAALNAGAPGDLTFLLKNIDIFSPEQVAFMKKNRRDAIHLAAAKAGNNPCPECRGKKVTATGDVCPHCLGTGRDPYSVANVLTGEGGEKKSEGGGYYAPGHTPNKSMKGFSASDLTTEQMAKVWEKWKNELKIEALAGISRWLNWAKRKGIPTQVTNMIKSASNPLSDTIAIYLCLELNSQKYGIYDPSVGLTNVPKSRKEQYDLTTEDPQELAKAFIDEELPKSLQQLGGGGGDQGPLKMSGKDATTLANALADASKHYKYFPEKIASYPIHWIMDVLERKGLATQKEPNEEGEDVGDDKGRDVKNDVLSSKSRSEARITRANNDTWTFAQRAYGNLDMGRRERERNPGKLELTGQQQPAGAEGKAGSGDFGSKGYTVNSDLTSILSNWLTRRGQLKPDTTEIVTQGQLLPTIQGMTDYLNTFRQRIASKIGEKATAEYDQASQELEKIATEQPKPEGDENAPVQNPEDEEFDSEKETAWSKYLTEVLSGKPSPIPMVREVEKGDEETGSELTHTVTFGPPVPLEQLAKIMSMNTVQDIVDKLTGLCSDRCAAKFAVPISMKLLNLDQATAIAQVEKAGVIPTQKQSVPMPQKQQAPQQQQPAMAATDLTDLTGILGQLPKNPGAWKQLETRQQELLKPVMKPAIDAARKAFGQKLMSKQPLTPDEADAYHFLLSITHQMGKV